MTSKMPMMLEDHMDALGGGIPSMDDDLFGDEVLPMAPRPPSKRLQQRVDELRSRGCCRSIAYSKHGNIASVSPDGMYINLQCPRANPSDGSWELGEPVPCSLISPALPGGPIVHLVWAPTINPELAVIDAFGRICWLSFPTHLNKATFVTRKWDGDAQDDLQTVVGCYWLPPNPLRPYNMVYGPALRQNDKYQFNNTVIQAFGPFHPNSQKSALACVTANGLLKLFFSQYTNQVQDISLEIESITSSEDLITHASICSERGERGKLLIVIATVAKQLKVIQAEINWGISQPQDKQLPPASMPLRPSLKAEHVATTSWLQQGVADSHLDASMDHISHLEVLPPLVDMRTKTITPATVLAVRLHVPTPQSHYDIENQSIIDRWDIVTDQSQQLHPAFEQRGSRTGISSSPGSTTRLRKRDSVVINKIIVSIETTLHGKIICIAFSDGTVQYRDRITMDEIYYEDQSQVAILQQAGFRFVDEKPSLQTVFSPTNCSFAQICENGKVKWNCLQYPVEQIGSTKQDPRHDAVLSSLTMAAANAISQNVNFDDILAVSRPAVGNHPRFLHDLVSTVGFMLSTNVDYSEEAHQDLVRNSQLQSLMSILNHFGFRGEFKPRSFTGKFSMLGLNIRNILILTTVASNIQVAQRINPLDEPEVVDALSGSIKWALDLLSWLADSLFILRADPKFMELIGDMRRFPEMTNYLKTKNQVSVHLLLCSSTRWLLSAICRRIGLLQAISTQAMQHWDSRMAANSADSPNLATRALLQAYMKLHRYTTTTLIKVDDFNKLLGTLSGDVRQTYQESLANLPKKQQQQQQNQHTKPGQPNPADAAVKRAQAHCEMSLLLGDQPPPSFQPVVKKLFETDLKVVLNSTERSKLFFTDFPLLDVEDEPRLLAAKKSEGVYVDVFRRVGLKPMTSNNTTNEGSKSDFDVLKVELRQNVEAGASESGQATWRRCVRCCAIMEDVVGARPGFNFVLAQQRRCSCGGSWALFS